MMFMISIDRIIQGLSRIDLDQETHKGTKKSVSALQNFCPLDDYMIIAFNVNTSWSQQKLSRLIKHFINQEFYTNFILNLLQQASQEKITVFYLYL